MTKEAIIEFQTNRANFPREELEKYADQWVAFSMDAKSILVSGSTIEELFEHADEAGINMHEVAIDHIVFGSTEVYLGGAEFE